MAVRSVVGARQEANLCSFFAFASGKDLHAISGNQMELFPQQDWLFNEKSSNGAFRTHLEIPGFCTSRASCGLTPTSGEGKPLPLTQTSHVRSAVGLSGATGRGGGTLIGCLCFVVGTSLQ